MESLEVTDQAAAAVAVAPRVTLDDINENIAGEHYLNVKEAIEALGNMPVSRSLSVLTLCIVVLRNGYTVIGHSAPADARNFNEELGRKLARENAIRQIWPLMGYALRDRIASQPPAPNGH